MASFDALNPTEHLIWSGLCILSGIILYYLLFKFIVSLGRLLRHSEPDYYTLSSFILLSVGIFATQVSSNIDDFVVSYQALSSIYLETLDKYASEVALFGVILRNMGLIVNASRWLLIQRKTAISAKDDTCLGGIS